MILVNTSQDLAPPNGAASKLVGVASLGHEDVTVFQVIFLNILGQYFNRLNLREIKKPILNIGDAEIGHFNSVLGS
jgi:hypothetical protein